MSTMVFLEDTILQQLTHILSRYREIHQVVLYGSRVKGTHTNRSDIDLVITQSSNLSSAILSEVKLDIDNSDIPYLVDINRYEDMYNEELKEHIQNDGIIIYEN